MKTLKPGWVTNSSGHKVDPKTLKAAFRIAGKVSDFLRVDLEQVELHKRMGTRNAWLETSAIKVYVRKAYHLIDSNKLECVLDLATIEVSPKWQRKGLFTTFLDIVQQAYPIVRIENILAKPLAESLLRKGWLPTTNSDPHSPTLFKRFPYVTPKPPKIK